jgi:hypothetical protein
MNMTLFKNISAMFLPVVLGVLVAGCFSPSSVSREPTPDDLSLLQERLRNRGISATPTLIEKDLSLGLYFGETNIADISFLRGIPLTELDLNGNISDLSPLRGMPLKRLSLRSQNGLNLSPLQGLPIKELDMRDTSVADLSPLKGMPLKTIFFELENVTNGVDVLAEIGTLAYINEQEQWRFFAAYFAENPPAPNEQEKRQRLIELTKPPLPDHHFLDVPENYVAPALQRLPDVDCAKVKPLFITAEQMNRFLGEVRGSNTALVLSYGETILRPYAKLSEGVVQQITEFQVAETSNSRAYFFRDSQGHGLNIVLEPTNMIVLSCTRVGNEGTGLLSSNSVPINDEEALGLVVNYLNYHADTYCGAGSYIARRSVFGKQTRFFSLVLKNTEPALSSCEFVQEGSYGRVSLKDLRIVTEICLAEFPQSDDPNVHKMIMNAFLMLCDHVDDEAQLIIARVQDIPVYRNRKLTPESEAKVCPMLAEALPDGSVAYTLCTYRQFGGTVRRYRFVFKDKKILQVPDCVELGRDIGLYYHAM